MKERWFWAACLLLLAVLLRGLFIDTMDVDASQYASISLEMLQNGQWLQVQHRHADYLDKPPLLFWTAAGSYALFGVSTAAYKLPSLLVALLGIYALYRFCRLFYPENTARLAALILGSSVGLTLLCNDVRTDTLLMGFSVATVWQMADYEQTKRWRSILLAGFFAGLAMLAKGPLGLILPIAALGTHILLHRNWKALWPGRRIWALVVAALVLAPMCWGLYQQFDLHPEKVVNDRQGVSGLYFFFWEQSFGRITGENVWKNDTTPLYFFHVYAWAMLPWTIWLVAAAWQRMKALFLNRLRLTPTDEGFSIGAFVFIFIALSASRYKLPHYIFVTLPWAAVWVARFITEKKVSRTLNIAQQVLVVLVGALLVVICGGVFPTFNPIIWGTTIALLALSLGWFNLETGLRTTFLGIAIGWVLNGYFYPQLLPYQSTSEAGSLIRVMDLPINQVFYLGRFGHSLDFHSRQQVPNLLNTQRLDSILALRTPIWVYTGHGGSEFLDQAGIPYTVVKRFQHFQPAFLKLEFLNPSTRPSTLETTELLRVDRQ
jgi:4-amino-4-deoxy-L-arabinose transferase-like glycosyltransferase